MGGRRHCGPADLIHPRNRRAILSTMSEKILIAARCGRLHHGAAAQPNRMAAAGSSNFAAEATHV